MPSAAVCHPNKGYLSEIHMLAETATLPIFRFNITGAIIHLALIGCLVPMLVDAFENIRVPAVAELKVSSWKRFLIRSSWHALAAALVAAAFIHLLMLASPMAIYSSLRRVLRFVYTAARIVTIIYIIIIHRVYSKVLFQSQEHDFGWKFMVAAWAMLLGRETVVIYERPKFINMLVHPYLPVEASVLPN